MISVLTRKLMYYVVSLSSEFQYALFSEAH
jgi:hypothetical protein